MLKIYTIQLSKWRLATAKGIKITDTTVKSGHHQLAPSWDMVNGIKNGFISEMEYKRRYKEVIERSQKNYPDFWRLLIENEIICLACYCRAGYFCHRHLLADDLMTYARSQNVDCEIMGELLE